jgi:hypothetical protein
MSEQLVRIAAFNTPVEANLAQSVLAGEGIESCLENDVAVGMVWYYGNAIGGVKLFVHESDAERARVILAERVPEQIGDDPQFNAAFPAGRCKKCDAKLEPGFEVCWSCGEPIEGQPASSLDAEPVADRSVPETSPVEKYRKRRRKNSEDSRETIIDEADDLAKKAWFASILFIPILNAYSVCLIVLLLINRFPLSRRGYRRLLYASVVDALVFVFMGWLIYWIIFH